MRETLNPFASSIAAYSACFGLEIAGSPRRRRRRPIPPPPPAVGLGRKLDELMMEASPRVGEVNAMCEEMALLQRFSVVLVANRDKAAATVRKGKEEYFETLVCLLCTPQAVVDLGVV